MIANLSSNVEQDSLGGKTKSIGKMGKAVKRER